MERSWLRFLDVCPEDPAVPMMMLAQLAWAPWSSLPEMGRVGAVVAATSGMMKTSLSGLVLMAQSRTFVAGKGIEPPVTIDMRGNTSTAFGTDLKLYSLSGLVALVDDWFAGKMTAKEIHDAWVRLGLIGSRSATGVGPTRGGYRNGKGALAKSSYPRSCVLATAEDLPEEEQHASEIARYVALRMDHAPDVRVLTEVQSSGRSMSRAHATMIQWGLRDLTAPIRAKAWGDDVVNGWRFTGHTRVGIAYERMLAGAFLVAEALEQHTSIGGQGMRMLAAEVFETAARDQARRAGMRDGQQIARDPVRLWIKHFREMIIGDPLWVAAPELASENQDSEQPEYRVPKIPGFGPASVGWRQMGQSGGWGPAGRGEPIGAAYVAQDRGRTPWRKVILRTPAARFDALHDEIVRRVRSVDGWSMPAS
ncbi:hypothetical protein ACWDT6_30115, partial [Nocardia grenadensis]